MMEELYLCSVDPTSSPGENTIRGLELIKLGFYEACL